jgi:hypothetical protein
MLAVTCERAAGVVPPRCPSPATPAATPPACACCLTPDAVRRGERHRQRAPPDVLRSG